MFQLKDHFVQLMNCSNFSKWRFLLISGFQRDFTTLLKWHTEQPNFWYRRPNEPIDEESYLTTGEQLRIKVVRKQVASMKSLYQRIIEDLYVSKETTCTYM